MEFIWFPNRILVRFAFLYHQKRLNRFRNVRLILKLKLIIIIDWIISCLTPLFSSLHTFGFGALVCSPSVPMPHFIHATTKQTTESAKVLGLLDYHHSDHLWFSVSYFAPCCWCGINTQLFKPCKKNSLSITQLLSLSQESSCFWQLQSTVCAAN